MPPEEEARATQIQHAPDDATSKPNALLAEVNRLKEVWQLKSRVLAHAKCGDRRINLDKNTTRLELVATLIFISFEYLIFRWVDGRWNSNRPLYSLACVFGGGWHSGSPRKYP
ncbi:hypothetical protein N7489_003583 [Penicillium chrysogenum]|uniref:uncharacterized protein n=1 Tax=Penicillium chrysogenum TaxID=5076 RepID=UPI0024DF1F09|nr:uncharacterized protein N7489_003583 [Penicillium chrysogenum]KAJ5253173.1 hypothetical protein N7489_003583 [Penicillium chrysogenum]KAJ6137006.1 hypothetical protein N7497_012258 [Penicillium chrysogenum]